jgi:hypothetical protein
MIDRIAELQRIALQRNVKVQTPIKAPRHGYVGVYEEFVIA